MILFYYQIALLRNLSLKICISKIPFVLIFSKRFFSTTWDFLVSWKWFFLHFKSSYQEMQPAALMTGDCPLINGPATFFRLKKKRNVFLIKSKSGAAISFARSWPVTLGGVLRTQSHGDIKSDSSSFHLPFIFFFSLAFTTPPSSVFALFYPPLSSAWWTFTCCGWLLLP